MVLRLRIVLLQSEDGGASGAKRRRATTSMETLLPAAVFKIHRGRSNWGRRRWWWFAPGGLGSQWLVGGACDSGERWTERVEGRIEEGGRRGWSEMRWHSLTPPSVSFQMGRVLLGFFMR